MNGLPWDEVFLRYEYAQQLEGERLYHQMRAASLPWCDQSARREYSKEIRRRMTFQIELAEDMIWSLDPMDRVRAIGSGIDFGGEEYMRSHPSHMQELADQGFTPEQAVAEYRAYLESVDQQIEWHDGRDNGELRARINDAKRQGTVVE